jgi:hypothetical protein
MKRILTSIAVLGLLVNVSFAQTSDGPIDLEALIALPLENSVLSSTGSLDTSKVLCGIRCNTADSILNTQSVLFYSSFNNFPTSTSVNASGFSFTNNVLFPASSIIFTFPNANELGAGHTGPFTLSADSIKALCNWADWQNDIFTTINRANLVPGQAYGFFFKAMGVQPEGAEVNEYREDPVSGTGAKNGNNRTAVKVIWGQGTSIEDMLAKKDKVNIDVYPNPSNDVINFNFNFVKPSHATAVVRDITGKIVQSRNLGRATTGEQKYSLNISSLSAGNYVLQFDTDEETAVAKFTVKK